MTEHADFAERSDSRDPQAASPPARHAASTKLTLTHVTHRAMATEFVLILPPHAPKNAVDVGLEVLERLDDIEASLTVYRPTSDVSRINQAAGKHPVAVNAATFAVVQRSIEWSMRTGGAMDITAGPLVDTWGFAEKRSGEKTGQKPNESEIAAALAKVGYASVQLDPTEQTIFLPIEGMKLNLGSIGKGDALDRLATAMRDRGCHDFLIHGGNSSLIAAGNESPENEAGWCVGLSHPTKPKRSLGSIWIKDAAMGTSGSGKQFFHHQGKRYSHVIDPRTGVSSSDLLSVSVIMPSAADADALATGLFVDGSDGIAKHVAQSPDWLPPIISVGPGRRQDEVVVETSGSESNVRLDSTR